MRPHPRIRKTIKWGGAAVTVLLTMAWIGSNFVGGGWCSPRGSFVWIAGGMLHAVPQNISNYSSRDIGWNTEWNQSAFGWWIETNLGSRGRGVRIPLWMLAIAPAIATVCLWRLDTLARRTERLRLGLCPTCSYDRTGLTPTTPCPECGTLPPLPPT